MKTVRNKKARKHLSFYINNFKFRQPFQILIDGTFAFAALESKFNIQDQLAKYFQADLKLLTTPCIIAETENLGKLAPNVNGAMYIVKQYPVHKCGHEKHAKIGAKCLKAMVANNNPSRYIIATQDRELQETLRKLPGVPLIYLHGKAPILEAPSEASREFADQMQKGLGMTTWEKQNVHSLKKEAGLLQESDKKLKGKRKKSGPNPLSCLKKKKKTESSGNSIKQKKIKSGQIKKRKRVKIPSHVKEILVKTHKAET